MKSLFIISALLSSLTAYATVPFAVVMNDMAFTQADALSNARSCIQLYKSDYKRSTAKFSVTVEESTTTDGPRWTATYGVFNDGNTADLIAKRMNLVEGCACQVVEQQ